MRLINKIRGFFSGKKRATGVRPKQDAPKQSRRKWDGEVRIPANIRRKCVGSKLFKEERDDKGDKKDE